MKYLFSIIFIFFIFVCFEGLKKDPREIPSNLISKEIPDFQLSGFENSDFKKSDLMINKVKIVNFFASWCPPCRVEHKQLIKLREKIPIYGIAKKNKENDLASWFKDLGNPYNKIGLDLDGIVSVDWGVYGLPETFIIDKNGFIKYKHVGPIMERDLEIIINIINDLE